GFQWGIGRDAKDTPAGTGAAAQPTCQGWTALGAVPRRNAAIRRRSVPSEAASRHYPIRGHIRVSEGLWSSGRRTPTTLPGSKAGSTAHTAPTGMGVDT